MAEELMVEPMAEVIAKAAARTFTTPQVVIIAAGAAIAVGGTAYWLGKKRAEKEAVKVLEIEIEKFREYYHKMSTEQAAVRKPSPAEVVEEKGYEPEPVKAPFDTQPTPYDRMSRKEDMEPVEVNVFDDRDTWDYSSEVKTRIANPELPYVIHVDEFHSNEPEHEQLSYTYFETDDILVDIEDNVITALDETVGLANLEKFGHGSKDPNVVYVRNEDAGLDFEVTRDAGSFTETIHGVVEHSDKPKGKGKRRDRRFDDE